MPHEVLPLDFWVPGSTSRLEADRFRDKAQFKGILNPTPLSALMYFQRAIDVPGFNLK